MPCHDDDDGMPKYVIYMCQWLVIGMFVWFKLPGIADTKSLIEKKVHMIALIIHCHAPIPMPMPMAMAHCMRDI